MDGPSCCTFSPSFCICLVCAACFVIWIHFFFWSRCPLVIAAWELLTSNTVIMLAQGRELLCNQGIRLITWVLFREGNSIYAETGWRRLNAMFWQEQQDRYLLISIWKSNAVNLWPYLPLTFCSYPFFSLLLIQCLILLHPFWWLAG